ncbi:MAG: hypothetical protein IKB60_06080 [Clostridia bacterium]|nr:hypothetical protein [Clostridia bacterium]
MDNFCEYLIKKKPTGLEMLAKVGIVILAILLSVVVFCVCLMVKILGTFSVFGPICVFYGAYVLLMHLSIEYEYIFTNGELDIDMIRGKKTRKRLVTIRCKDINIMEKADVIIKKNDGGKKVLDARYDAGKGGVYKIDATSKKGNDVLVYFQPPERLVEEMKRYNPSKIIAE